MSWLGKLRSAWQTAVSSASITQTATAVLPVSPRVLLIVHAPRVMRENGRKLHQILGWHDPDWLAQQYINDLRDASYGYLNYQIVERIEVNEFPVKADGFVYDADTYLYRWRSRTGFHIPDLVDYPRLLRQFKIIPRINLDQIDEVWLMAFPYAGYYESVMGFNYERGVGEMLESFGHRVESIMSHVYRHKKGDANLWERFIRYDKTHPGVAECGNVHFAPNSERDYDWGNQRWVRSFGDSWLQFPQLDAPSRRVNCSEWGDGDIRQHHLWWLRHLPHVEGKTGGISNNWWQYAVNLVDVQ